MISIIQFFLSARTFSDLIQIVYPKYEIGRSWCYATTVVLSGGQYIQLTALNRVARYCSLQQCSLITIAQRVCCRMYSKLVTDIVQKEFGKQPSCVHSRCYVLQHYSCPAAQYVQLTALLYCSNCSLQQRSLTTTAHRMRQRRRMYSKLVTTIAWRGASAAASAAQQ